MTDGKDWMAIWAVAAARMRAKAYQLSLAGHHERADFFFRLCRRAQDKSRDALFRSARDWQDLPPEVF